MSEHAVLYHTMPARRLAAILRAGIRPECARGARAEGWLHTPGRLGCARGHVAARHGAAGVVSLRVSVRRARLTRRRVWTTARAILPGLIQAVNVCGLVGGAAA
jgi:hypothetical protein